MFFTRIKLIRIVLILMGLTGVSLPISAQGYEDYTKIEFVQELKGSVLLVRLQDKAISIRKLVELGRNKEAETLKQKQYQENREILLSFKNTFDFCPVYFFYSSNSEAIREGNYEGHLFDADQKAVNYNGKNAFIAEFSETEELGIDGLILKDSKMLALPEHLPYFERRFVLMGMIERSKARIIEAYNHKLYGYLDMD